MLVIVYEEKKFIRNRYKPYFARFLWVALSKENGTQLLLFGMVIKGRFRLSYDFRFA